MEELDALNHPSPVPPKRTIDEKLNESKTQLDTKLLSFLRDYHVSGRDANKDFIKELCDYAQLSIQKYNQHATMVNDSVQKIPISIVAANRLDKFITNISRIKDQIQTDSSYCEVFKKDSAPYPASYYLTWLTKILQKIKLSFNFGLQCGLSIKDGAEFISTLHRKYATSSSSDDAADMKSHFDSIVTLNNSNTIFKNDIENIETLVKQTFMETDKPLITNIVKDIHLFNGKITQMVKLYEEMVQMYKKINIPNSSTNSTASSVAIAAVAAASASASASASATTTTSTAWFATIYPIIYINIFLNTLYLGNYISSRNQIYFV